MKQALHASDPIVAEVRKARAELYAECGRDLHKLFARIRKQEQAQRRKTRHPTRRAPKPSSSRA